MKSIFVKTVLRHDEGNTYHSCAIETDGATIYAPFQYGYGTQYKYTALEALKEAGLISCEHNEVCRWERDNGYPIEWSVSEGTQTECKANGKA